jgi:hypothetical protein
VFCSVQAKATKHDEEAVYHEGLDHGMLGESLSGTRCVEGGPSLMAALSWGLIRPAFRGCFGGIFK